MRILWQILCVYIFATKVVRGSFFEEGTRVNVSAANNLVPDTTAHLQGSS